MRLCAYRSPIDASGLMEEMRLGRISHKHHVGTGGMMSRAMRNKAACFDVYPTGLDNCQV